MGGIGFPELIIIFLVLLLVFGAKRIPEIARGIGKGIREFKDATNEISQELEAESKQRQINQPQAPQQGAPQARRGQQQDPSQPAASESASSEESASSATASDESESQQSGAAETNSQNPEKTS